MLSEEKKAIEYLKQNSIPILRYDNFGNILSPLYYGTFEKEAILNLIEKQQKEIEELKEKNKKCEYYEMVSDELYKNSISKDKIKAKIEEIKKENEQNRKDLERAINFSICNNIREKIFINMCIKDTLKSLLEEE